MRIAVYPGSFDPITNGHLDVISRAAKIFDKVIVSILFNSNKKPTFTVAERIEFIKKATSHIDNVEVDSFKGLLVNYLKEKNSKIIIKGLRAISDFEYEFTMASLNHKIEPEVETLFMMTNVKYSYLSSSIVKEIASLGGSLDDLVPDIILEEILDKFKQ